MSIKSLNQVIDVLAKSGLYKTEKELAEAMIDIGILANRDSFEYTFDITRAMSKAEFTCKPLAEEVRDWVNNSDGNFALYDIYSSLHLTSRNDKKNVSVILLRLLEDGVVQRVGDKSGHFRRIDGTFKPIESFNDEDTVPIDLKFPLKMEMYGKIFQSNIMVIAGEKDTGKTGFCLSFATMNMDVDKNIRYISSEFGSAELKSRLDPMGFDPQAWIKRIEFGQFQRNNAQDAIDPDGINIVDFLEADEGRYYMVGEQVKQIYQKLRTGTALIAMQKKRNEDYARGGELSAEKARLYVTLSRVQSQLGFKNYAKIVHCKNRAIPEVNPNGLRVEYKLGGGHFFSKQGDWMPE